MRGLFLGLAFEGIAFCVEETPGLEAGCAPDICQPCGISGVLQDGVLGIEPGQVGVGSLGAALRVDEQHVI